MLQAIGVSILGGFATYVLARIGTGKGGAAKPPAGLVAPTVPQVPELPPAPKPAPVEQKPPPVAPAPPVDTKPSIPTPATPPPVVAPPPPPAPVAPPAPVIEPPVRPAPIETAPPAPPPVPPVDTAPTLPTPPVDRPDRPFSDVVVDVPVPVRQVPITPATEPSIPVDTSNGPPAGFDPTIASTLAPSLASNIATKQYDFDRSLLKKFQAAAGIAADGIYGNDSWGALLYFTSAAPRALYQPSVPTPYAWGPWVSRMAAPPAQAPAAPVAPAAPPAATPAAPAVDVGPVPPDGFNPTTARKLAKQVAANIDSKGINYSRDQLKAFQKAAGIDQDGIYGGGSRRALIFYGIARPPQPLFKPTATPATYPWEQQAKAAQ